jgi:hypothetical protein
MEITAVEPEQDETCIEYAQPELRFRYTPYDVTEAPLRGVFAL